MAYTISPNPVANRENFPLNASIDKTAPYPYKNIQSKGSGSLYCSMAENINRPANTRLNHLIEGEIFELIITVRIIN